MLQGVLLAWGRFADEVRPMPQLSSSASDLKKFGRH